MLAGVGVLSTPYALQQGGWGSLVLLFSFAAICCYTGLLLKHCIDAHPGLLTYPDIGWAAFGHTGRLIISVSGLPHIATWRLAQHPTKCH